MGQLSAISLLFGTTYDTEDHYGDSKVAIGFELGYVCSANAYELLTEWSLKIKWRFGVPCA